MSTFKGIDTEEDLKRWLGLNALPGNDPVKAKGDRKPLVEPGIVIEPWRLTILVAVETKNENNQRQWKAKNRRAGQAWLAVRKAIGPNLCALEPYAKLLASGRAVRARFTRLGGRRMDQLANLGGAFKGVEDALCFLLGIDDGSPQWHAIPEQEAGEEVGVRIELEVFK